MRRQLRRVVTVKILSKIKKVIPVVKKQVALVSRELGHRYGDGMLYGKHVIGLAFGSIFRCSDRELPDELQSRGLLKILGYNTAPDHSIFSKVRSEVGEEKIGRVAESIICGLYKDRFLRLIAIDSSYVPYYFEDDLDAVWGYATLTKKEQEVLKEKTQKGLKRGYKLHVIYDVEMGIPLYWIVLPANIHDKDAFKTLFDYVKTHFKFTHEAKFLADSAYDSTDIKEECRRCGINPVISRNGRRWRKSETPKDPDYGKRWAIERIFSRLKEVFGMARNRFVGMKKVSIHVFSCLLAYTIRYVM